MTIVIGSNQAHAYMKDADYCCTLPGCMSHGYGAVPMILEEPMRGGGMLDEAIILDDLYDREGGRGFTKAQPQRLEESVET